MKQENPYKDDKTATGEASPDLRIMKPFIKQQLSTFFDCIEQDTSNYKMLKETLAQHVRRND